MFISLKYKPLCNEVHSDKSIKASSMNSEVDVFISKAKAWRQEFEQLRMIVLDCGLTEELKWGKPCYRYNESNVVIIQGFKHYCALLFFKGALLNDTNHILIQQTENVQSARQVRFTDVKQITEQEPILKIYISNAVAIEKAGLKLNLKEKPALIFPEELQHELDDSPALQAAFAALTPGRQRAYNLYFSAPKQSSTRASRVQKCMPQILNGRGLNE